MRCRPLSTGDRDAVASLLARSFPQRSLAFWHRALRRLGEHSIAHDAPSQGHLLMVGEALVGCILTIWSRKEVTGRTVTSCNLSSWCVDEPYRSYASLLVHVATRDRSVTYTNDSPAPHTREIIAAQGFSPYVTRTIWTLASLARAAGPAVRIVDGAEGPPGVPSAEQALMRAHARLGCLTFWCFSGGEALPFVFARQRRARGLLPVAFLVYCRGLDSLVRHARPIGLHLLRKGLPVLRLDAEEPIVGLPGLLRPAETPKFYRGPVPPRPGDQAYSELTLFGL